MRARASTCARMDDVMAGWYKQHTSELASLEAFAQCGRIDLVLAWLRVTRWTVDQESDALPQTLEQDAANLEAAGLRTTFATRCKKLLDQREAMAAKRESKRAQVSSSELTSDHVSSSDHQDKTRQDKTTKTRKTKPHEIPADWAPTAEHEAKAKEIGLTLAYQAETFRLHAKTHARLCASWNGAFSQWLIKADPAREPAHVKPRPVVKGWNDDDFMNGIPRGKTS